MLEIRIVLSSTEPGDVQTWETLFTVSRPRFLLREIVEDATNGEGTVLRRSISSAIKEKAVLERQNVELTRLALDVSVLSDKLRLLRHAGESGDSLGVEGLKRVLKTAGLTNKRIKKVLDAAIHAGLIEQFGETIVIKSLSGEVTEK